MSSPKRSNSTYGLLIVVIILGIGLAFYIYNNEIENPKNSIQGEQKATDLPANNESPGQSQQIITTATPYIQKSASEMRQGDKEAALKTVEEGLKVDPENELLKSRRDVLLKDNFNNPNLDMTKE